MKPLDNGAVLWGTALAFPLGLTAFLGLTGRTTLSSHARNHPVITTGICSYFYLHFRRELKYDPLSMIARQFKVVG